MKVETLQFVIYKHFVIERRTSIGARLVILILEGPRCVEGGTINKLVETTWLVNRIFKPAAGRRSNSDIVFHFLNHILLPCNSKSAISID